MQQAKAKVTIEDIVEAYDNGASDVEVAALLRITMSKFEAQYNSNDNFKRLVELGRLMSKAWWYKQARTNINNKQFNAQIYNFYMKNRFGWADKTENYNQSDLPLESLSQDELLTRINQFQDAWAKQNKQQSSSPDYGNLLGAIPDDGLAKTKRN